MIDMMFLTQMFIFVPIIVAVLIFIMNRVLFSYLVFISQAVQTIILYNVWKHLTKEGIILYTLGGWSREIGIEIKIDNLSFLFLLMAVIIWWIILVYAWSQKKADYKFLFFLMFLQGCFNAFVMANDFFTLFVLIEIITIISAILILYKKDGISVKAGLYYLLFNSFGMAFYLFGLIFLYLKVGTENMSIMAEVFSTGAYTDLNFSFAYVSFTCFFVALCVKAALFPVYDWLPRAHTAAPAYISALLSGLLVKSGIYGLLRILDIFNFIDIYDLLFYLGFFTAVSGFVFAISQKDIKAILAFHTISQIGLIIMSLATATDVGLLGAYLHIFNHFIFKSILFLGAGVIINEYGVRRVTEIKGIGRAHPILSLCMAIAILSITGAPLFIGFLSKTMIKMSMMNPTQEIMVQIVSVGTLISFIKFSKIFFGKTDRTKKINKVQMAAIIALTMVCLVTFFLELDLAPSFLRINGDFSQSIAESIVYIQKASFNLRYFLDYFVLMAIAYIIYKLFVRPNNTIWHFLRHFRVRFQDAIVSMMLFIILILNYI